jgi:hypothetical protein
VILAVGSLPLPTINGSMEKRLMPNSLCVPCSSRSESEAERIDCARPRPVWVAAAAVLMSPATLPVSTSEMMSASGSSGSDLNVVSNFESEPEKAVVIR